MENGGKDGTMQGSRQMNGSSSMSDHMMDTSPTQIIAPPNHQPPQPPPQVNGMYGSHHVVGYPAHPPEAGHRQVSETMQQNHNSIPGRGYPAQPTNPPQNVLSQPRHQQHSPNLHHQQPSINNTHGRHLSMPDIHRSPPTSSSVNPLPPIMPQPPPPQTHPPQQHHHHHHSSATHHHHHHYGHDVHTNSQHHTHHYHQSIPQGNQPVPPPPSSYISSSQLPLMSPHTYGKSAPPSIPQSPPLTRPLASPQNHYHQNGGTPRLPPMTTTHHSHHPSDGGNINGSPTSPGILRDRETLPPSYNIRDPGYGGMTNGHMSHHFHHHQSSTLNGPVGPSPTINGPVNGTVPRGGGGGGSGGSGYYNH